MTDSSSIEKDDCAICLSPIPKLGNVRTACNHTFCLNCFLKHAETKNVCPLCRNEFKDPSTLSTAITQIEWERLIYNVRMTASALQDNGGTDRTIHILSHSPSPEYFERAAIHHYQNFMEQRTIQAIAEAAAQERAEIRQTNYIRYRASIQRRQARRSQDRERGIIVGAKICLNPNQEATARRQLHIDPYGDDDNKEATIIKVMIVNIDVRLDHSQKIVRFRKDSPHYSFII